MFKWSGEQEKAISFNTALNGAAIISAAAGSGKTAMLVERITRMLTSVNPKIPADKIVAVTFTNDAAGELKTRLEQAVSRVISKSAENNESAENIKNDWLNEQLINLENANISTISSFCARLLREYAEEAGLRPDFRICDEQEAEQYSRRALDFALDRIYDGSVFSNEEKNALRSTTGEAGDGKLASAVLGLHREYLKQPFPEKWLAEKISLYELNGGERDFIFRETLRRIKNDAKSCLDYIHECMELSYSDSMKKRIELDLAFAESWINISDIKQGLREYGDSYYGGAKDEKKELKERIKELRDIYIPIFKDIKINAGLLSDFDYVTEKQEPQVKALSRLFGIYREKFTELKKEANCADFSDVEHYTLELLQNEQLAETIRERFYEIIVDEFQDSNALQYEIFKKLSKNEKNLFFVGDVKQSVYRFRNADQRVFSRVSESVDFTTLTLNGNFRSSEEVVNAVNNIFGKVMTKETGGVDYDDGARLIFCTDNTGGKTHEAELVIIETTEPETDENTTESEITDNTNSETLKSQNQNLSEAEYIAERVIQMVGSGFEVTEKNGVRRPCDYGDFAVLVSGLSTVEDKFSAAFEARGIPYDKQKSGDYTAVDEVKTIAALLTVIERPFENMELLSVLTSPLYNFTADDVARVRKNAVEKTLFENLSDYIKRENCEDKTYYKTKKILADLKRWAAYSKNNGAAGLVGLIYNEGGFNPLAAASKTPEKTMINIRLLLYYSKNFKHLTKDSVSGLVNVLNSRDGQKALIEEARYSGESMTGRVKLMSIHASKGLEFPVCFVARTNAGFNLRENYSDIIFSDNIGFALRYIITETRTRCDTLLHKRAREENTNAALSEEMRKLYVACTRARDKLILTAARHNEKITPRSYLNWLIQSGIKKEIIKASDITLTVSNSEDKSNFTLDEKAQTEAIIKAVETGYSREPLTTIPRRVTATQIGVKKFSGLETADFFEDEIKTKPQDEPTIFPRGASFMENRKLTGKKRGDAYHKVMELIDFKKGDYEKQLDEHKTRFTKEEFAAIEPKKIRAFFDGVLGKRAAASPKIFKEFKLCTEISLSELGFPPEYDETFEERPFIQGIADMFFYEGDEIVLVDYKTNRNTSREKLTEQYGRQLEIYSRAIEEMTGDKVKERWIYSFELGAAEVSEFSSDNSVTKLIKLETSLKSR